MMHCIIYIKGTKDNLKKNTPKGRIPGYHARTGAEMWKFWIIPVDPDDPAMVTWPNGTQDIGSGNAWAPLSGDEELGRRIHKSCAWGHFTKLLYSRSISNKSIDSSCPLL